MKFYIPYRIRAKFACWLIGHHWKSEFSNGPTITHYVCAVCDKEKQK